MLRAWRGERDGRRRGGPHREERMLIGSSVAGYGSVANVGAVAIGIRLAGGKQEGRTSPEF